MEPVPSTGIRNIGNEAQNFHALLLAFAIKGDAALPFSEEGRRPGIRGPGGPSNELQPACDRRSKE